MTTISEKDKNMSEEFNRFDLEIKRCSFVFDR